MKNMKKLFAVTAIIALALACSAFACSGSQQHQAARAAASFADSLNGVEQVNEQVYAAGLLSADETIAVAQSVAAATRANDAFVNCLKITRLAPESRSAIFGCFRQVESAVAALDPAVIGIKNPDAQARFNLAFQTVKAALAVIEGAIGYQPPKPAAGIWVPHPSPSERTARSEERVGRGGAPPRQLTPEEMRTFRQWMHDLEVDRAMNESTLRDDRPALKQIHMAPSDAEPNSRGAGIRARLQSCRYRYIKDGALVPAPPQLEMRAAGVALSPTDWTQLIAMAINSFGLLAPIIMKMKKESGLSEEELEAAALSEDEQTRSNIATFVAHVRSQSQAASSPPANSAPAGGE